MSLQSDSAVQKNDTAIILRAMCSSQACHLKMGRGWFQLSASVWADRLSTVMSSTGSIHDIIGLENVLKRARAPILCLLAFLS